MDFSAFDKSKLDEYAAQAKATWGQTDAYKEFEKKTAGVSKEEQNAQGMEMMQLFTEFGQLKAEEKEAAGKEAQAQVKKLQDYITEHFYTCTDTILASLGTMYAGGGSMTENIDRAGGTGTAEFAAKAIEIYCNR